VRISDEGSFRDHQEYIFDNPVKAGLAGTAEDDPYSSAYLRKLKQAGAKAQAVLAADGTTKVVP